MISLKSSTIIHRPVEEVFKYVATDYFQNRPKWANDGFNFENTSGEPMHRGLNSNMLSADSTGKQVETTLRVTEYELNKMMIVRTSSVFAGTEAEHGKPIEGKRIVSTETERTYAFEPVAGGTN